MISPEMIMKMFEEACGVSRELLRSFDELKFAEASSKLYETANTDDIYKMMAEVIKNDDTLSTDEKLERLERLTEKMHEVQNENQDKQASRIDSHERNRGKIAGDVVAAVFTGGISVGVKAIAGAVKKKKTQQLISAQNTEEETEEDTEEDITIEKDDEI